MTILDYIVDYGLGYHYGGPYVVALAVAYCLYLVYENNKPIFKVPKSHKQLYDAQDLDKEDYTQYFMFAGGGAKPYSEVKNCQWVSGPDFVDNCGRSQLK